MKVMICGSMFFARDMLLAKEKLEKLGHEVFLPCDVDVHIEDPSLNNNLDKDERHLRENDVLRKCFKTLADSDAVLFINNEKNGVKGYLGNSCIMEIGIAYYLNKKIFLLHPLPSSKVARWASEVSVMNIVVLNGRFEDLK